MKAIVKTAVIGAVLMALSLGSVTLAAQTAKDPTKYDCRVVVGYRIIDRASKGQIKLPIFECPYKDKMVAGQCETSWLFGMRCKK
jgi:hypothetical protein